MTTVLGSCHTDTAAFLDLQRFYPSEITFTDFNLFMSPSKPLFSLPAKLARPKPFSPSDLRSGFRLQILAAWYRNKMKEILSCISWLMFSLVPEKLSDDFKSFPLYDNWPSQDWEVCGGGGWCGRQGRLRQMKKNKVPVPCDHGVRRSGGDACEGDWFLVVGSGIEGLLEHGEHRRDCGEKSAAS